MSKIYTLREECKGVVDCGICIYVCPKGVLGKSDVLNRKGFFPPEVVGEDACTQCENCMIFCPDMAIVVEKRKKKRATQ
ncbi:MAG: ferredoxin family protein [Thermodesulfobacteriota bacterium]